MPQSFQHKKSLGQHFLNNSRIPSLMAEAGGVSSTDTVLEIGPGTGALTKILLKTGAKVVAVEADIRAYEKLRELCKTEIDTGKLVLVHGDIRTLPLDEIHTPLMKNPYKVVANIPYYLSGMLFRLFLTSETPPTDVIFLVQKEVAERVARDKKESLLSLSVKVYGEPQYVKTVKRGNFTPPPKVDSAIIAIRNISKKSFKNVTESVFFSILHAGLGSKRKQLLGNLTTLFSREVLLHTFSTLGLSEDVRGEDLNIEAWLSLTHALLPHMKDTESA